MSDIPIPRMNRENLNLRKWSTLLVRFLAIYILITSMIAAPIMATDTPSGEERLWFSGDEDEKTESDLTDVENLDGTGEDIDPAEYARTADASYAFTEPRLSINSSYNNSTSYMEWRRQQLLKVDRDRDESIVLPTTEETESGRYIKDAHITFLGVNGGARPQFETDGEEHPIFISEQGEVLNFVDYRIKDGAVPNDYCEDSWSIETSTHEHEKTIEYEENGTTKTKNITVDTIHYNDGDNVCHDFSVSTHSVVRTLTIGDGSPVTEVRDPEGRVMEYSSINAQGEGNVTLTLRARISFVIREEIEHWDWDNTGDQHDSTGEWDITRREYDYSRRDTEVVETTRNVVITEKQELDIEQTVINVDDDQKHLVLDFKGPDSGDTIEKSDLYNRNLWSAVVISENQSVGGTWNAYSMKRYNESAEVRTGDSTYSRDFPHVLQTRLVAGSRVPSVMSDSNSVGKSTEVIGYTGMNVSTSDTSLPENVNVTSRTPLVQDQMVIANSPSEVETVLSIHGEEINVETVNRVPYREPNVTIQEVNDNGRLRIEVTDPVTGEGLAGRNMDLFGVDKDSATTNSDGVVYADRTNAYVEVTLEGDNWRSPGNVYYGSVKASKTYLSGSELIERAVDVVYAGMAAVPFAILFFLWRQNTLPD